MPTVSFQAPTDYSAEAEEIARRRKYAEMLQAQSMEPIATPQTPAGGFTPNVSWTQGLAKMLQAYSGRKGQDAATAEQKALAEKYTADRGAALAAALRARDGTLASTETFMDEQANGGEGQMAQINAPAVQGSRDAMINVLGASRFPDLQQLALAEKLKTPESAFAKIDPVHFTPDSVAKFSQTGRHADLVPRDKIVSDSLGGTTRYRTEYSPTPIGPDAPHTVAPKEDELARAIQAAGLDPNSPEAKALYQQRAVKIATHAPPTRVNVNQSMSTEKKYGEAFAGKIATADSEMRDAAIKAPQLAERANQIKQILANGNVITGAGADIRLAMDKALALAGVKSADGTAANTETLASGLAQNTLDAIKASGLGSGNGFSNADRDFLEKAVGGKITLQKETIDRLANLAHRAADQTAKRWSTRVREIPASALEGTGIKSDPVQVAPLFGGAAGNSAVDALLEKYR